MEAWAAGVAISDLFVTALTIAEIERGVVARERSDERQGATLRPWFDENVLRAFDGRVPAFDDARVAAVAQPAGMTVATRHTRHVEPLGVAYLDPWAQG